MCWLSLFELAYETLTVEIIVMDILKASENDRNQIDVDFLGRIFSRQDLRIARDRLAALLRRFLALGSKSHFAAIAFNKSLERGRGVRY